MDDENSMEEELVSWEADSYEYRCSQRLEDELGINQAGAVAILHMRSQIRELQERLRQLETELSVRRDSRQRRLSRYREVYFEATWYEFKQPDQDEN